MPGHIFQIRHGLLPVLGADIIVGPGQIIEHTQGLVGQILLLDGMQGVLGLVIPAKRAVTQGHPEARLGHSGRKPLEMLVDVIESSGGSEEITVHVLGFAHHHPGIVQEGVELVASPESLLLGRAALLGGLLLDGVQLYGLLHLLDGALEIACRLGLFLVGAGLGGMYQYATRIIVLVLALHLLELLVVMGFAVVIDVVARSERLPVARHGSILARTASRQNQQSHSGNGREYGV